jgi:hypothetical protein
MLLQCDCKGVKGCFNLTVMISSIVFIISKFVLLRKKNIKIRSCKHQWKGTPVMACTSRAVQVPKVLFL